MLGVALTSKMDNCYSYTAAKPEWEDISHGQKLLHVASQSSAVWATLKTKHRSGFGYKIAMYNSDARMWLADVTQPVGANFYGLTVDSGG